MVEFFKFVTQFAQLRDSDLHMKVMHNLAVGNATAVVVLGFFLAFI